ncbi:MAG: ATP-binding cassette domain-containing protein [Bacteroidaceae bacterium]|nr:ATP-binding cassette domain-containing protein [Bacteroidaceae bacterium]
MRGSMEEDERGKLLIDSVQLDFGKTTVLQCAYMTAYKGKVTGVLGRNGTGKSCLFKCIMGGIRPQNKFIRLNDEERTDYGHIGLRVKYLPQEHFIPRGMRVGRAFELYGVDYNKMIAFSPAYEDYKNMKFKDLSGGEQRIAELFLVLNADAEFCILDEPFSNIAPCYDEKIRNLILEQKATKGIIITDHIYEEIIKVADDLYLLRDGYTHQIHSREDLVRLEYIRG